MLLLFALVTFCGVVSQTLGLTCPECKRDVREFTKEVNFKKCFVGIKIAVFEQLDDFFLQFCDTYETHKSNNVAGGDIDRHCSGFLESIESMSPDHSSKYYGEF